MSGAAADIGSKGEDPPVRVSLRPIGAPLPLGLTALAVGSFLISARELGWLGSGADFEVGLVLVGLVFPFQLISAVLGFLVRDPVAGTGTALTSGAWLVTGIDKLIPGADSHAYGVALIAVVASLAVPLASSWLSNRAVFAVLAATALRFLLSALFALGAGTAIETLAGGLGVVVALLALGVAMLTELRAMRSPLAQEAGVRPGS